MFKASTRLSISKMWGFEVSPPYVGVKSSKWGMKFLLPYVGVESFEWGLKCPPPPPYMGVESFGIFGLSSFHMSYPIVDEIH